MQTVNHPPTVAKGILMVGRHPFNNSPRVARRGTGKKRENMYMLDKFRYCPVCGSKHFEESTAKSKRCRNCGFEYFLNASSATAAFILNARGELLVERRKEEPGRGTLDLPGGFCDTGETLEEGMVREVLEVVLDLARGGMTMLIVTHEMRFAEAVADRVIFLENGGIVEESAPETFFHQPKTERAAQFLQSFDYKR